MAGNRRAGNPQSSLAPIAAGAALLGVAAGAWFGLPGGAALFVASLVVAFTEPAPALTGPRRLGAAPIPASPAEEKALERYRVWRAARVALLPGTHWIPGKDPQASWLAGVVAATLAAGAPATSPLYRAVAALGVFAALTGLGAALREVTDSPGSSLSSVRELAQSSGRSRILLVAAAAGGAIVAAAAAYAAVVVLRSSPGPGVPWPVPWMATAAVLGAGLAVLPAWRNQALSDFRELVAEHARWVPRWEALKVEPAPQCLETMEVGGARFTTFMASGSRSSTELVNMAGKITPLAGPGMSVAVLTVPNETASGPVPGTAHPTKVQIAFWPTQEWPDLGDPGLDPQVAELAVQFALAAAMPASGMAAASTFSVEPIHEEGSTRAAWRVALSWPSGGGPTGIRVGGVGPYGMTGGMLGQALLDHRAENGSGVLYVGDIAGADIGATLRKTLDTLEAEDTWNTRWSAAAKTTVNPPVLQAAQTATAELAGGASIERTVFAVRVGMDPSELTTPATERRMVAAVGASSLLTITAWAQGVGTRPGDRHGQALVIYKGTGRMPASPEQLAPARGDGPRWYLTARINHGFDHCRMARPEIVTVKALTTPKSRAHIWEIRLRLYGGVAFGDVRAQGERLRQALGVAWLRVADADDGCTLFVGAPARSVELASPGRDTARLTALDWDQAFVDSKVTGAGGLVPSLTAAGVMPHNDKVEVLDFRLRPGLDVGAVRDAIPKLRTSSGNAFIQVTPGVDGADSIRVLCSKEDPMPFPAPFDYEVAAGAARHEAFFGVGVDGEPVAVNTKELAHLLVVGLSGSGKSVFVQGLLGSWAMKPACDAEFYVIDIQKKGADFRFLSPYLTGEAYEAREAEALMRAIYNRAKERLERNAQLGVGNVTDWEEPPPHMVVVIDEFTSLILTETVSRTPFDDPGLEANRIATLADNSHRIAIGQYAGKFARELRSAGVTMVLATQQIKADTLKTIPGGDTLKAQLARILLGNAGFGEKSSALKRPSEAPDLGAFIPKGRGLFEGETYPVPIQGWFEPNLSRLVEAVAAAREPVAPEDRIDITGFLAPEIDQGPAVVAVDIADFAPGGEVIDLGSIELSLGDLDLDDLEDSDETTEPVVVDEQGTPPEDFKEDVVDWTDSARSWGESQPEPVDHAVDEDIPVADPEPEPAEDVPAEDIVDWAVPSADQWTTSEPEPAIVEPVSDPSEPGPGWADTGGLWGEVEPVQGAEPAPAEEPSWALDGIDWPAPPSPAPAGAPNDLGRDDFI